MLFGPPFNASWIEPLPDGHQGTMRTLEAMRYLVRKDYRSEFTCRIVECVLTASGSSSTALALFLYARDRIRYQDDPPGIERIADFRVTTCLGYGDCDDKVVWLATALLAKGISVRFVVQSLGEEWNHVYLEFYDWAQWGWVALDATADGHTGLTGEIGWRQPLPLDGYEMRYEV